MTRSFEITRIGPIVFAFSYDHVVWTSSREQDLQRQLTVTKTQLRDLRLSNESNQAKLLDHTQKQGMDPRSRHKTTVIDCSLDEEVVAKLAEVDMTIADLDRANSRIVALEHRNVSNVLRPVPCSDCISGNPASRNWDNAYWYGKFGEVRKQPLLIKPAPQRRLRVQDLKSQIAELEQEMESLSHSLESQKTFTAEVETIGRKKGDELLRELQKKVRSLSPTLHVKFSPRSDQWDWPTSG